MAQEKGYRVMAEFSIHPISEGTGVSGYVRAALAELRKARGLRLQATPMATVIEFASLSDVLMAVEAEHGAVFLEGAKRVDFALRVDDRRDKQRRMEDRWGPSSQRFHDNWEICLIGRQRPDSNP